MILLILFGLMIDRSTAELQSPRTKTPSSSSSRRMTFPGRYLLTFLFINYIYQSSKNHVFSRYSYAAQSKYYLLQILMNFSVLKVCHLFNAFFFRVCQDWFRSNRKASRSFSLRPLVIPIVYMQISTLGYMRASVFISKYVAGQRRRFGLWSYPQASFIFLLGLGFVRNVLTLDPFNPTNFFQNSAEQSKFGLEGTKNGFSEWLFVILKDLFSTKDVEEVDLGRRKLSLRSISIQS